MLAIAGPGRSLVTAPVVAAAEPTFGKADRHARPSCSPSRSSSRRRCRAGVHRLEALRPDGLGRRTFLADVPNPGTGDHLLRYVHPTPSGAHVPEHAGAARASGSRSTTAGSSTARRRRSCTRTPGSPGTRSRATSCGSIGTRATDAFGRRALRIGEQAIKDASALLGVTETDPIDYFVYADTNAFYDVLGPAIRENVGGIALPEIRTLFANIPPADADASVGRHRGAARADPSRVRDRHAATRTTSHRTG